MNRIIGIKNCLCCNKLFRFKLSRALYCSKECNTRHNGIASGKYKCNNNMNCKNCGISFERKGNSPKIFCSDLCVRTYRKSKPSYKEYLKDNNEKGKARYMKNRASKLYKSTLSRRIKRLDVIDAYGGKCNCCGEDNEKFLTLDHIYNDGKKHGLRGHPLVAWTIKHNYPKDRIQILCWNCNLGKALNRGICPHKQPRPPKGFIEEPVFINKNEYVDTNWDYKNNRNIN